MARLRSRPIAAAVLTLLSAIATLSATATATTTAAVAGGGTSLGGNTLLQFIQFVHIAHDIQYECTIAIAFITNAHLNHIMSQALGHRP